MRTFFNFEPFTDKELEGFSPEQLAIEMQFMRATFTMLAALAWMHGDCEPTPLVGGKVVGI